MSIVNNVRCSLHTFLVTFITFNGSARFYIFFRDAVVRDPPAFAYPVTTGLRNRLMHAKYTKNANEKRAQNWITVIAATSGKREIAIIQQEPNCRTSVRCTITNMVLHNAKKR